MQPEGHYLFKQVSPVTSMALVVFDTTGLDYCSCALKQQKQTVLM